MTTTKSGTRPTVKLVRCAVYTRKSTEEGLEQEFNGLDARRDAGEAYVRSQCGEGRVTGGRAFTRTSLYQLLTNPLYAGRVRYKADVFPGEHPALVDPATFDRVPDRLRTHGTQGAGPGSPDRYGALLKGLLRCGPRRAAMIGIRQAAAWWNPTAPPNTSGWAVSHLHRVTETSGAG